MVKSKVIIIKTKEEFLEYAENKSDIDRIIIKFKDPKIKRKKNMSLLKGIILIMLRTKQQVLVLE